MLGGKLLLCQQQLWVFSKQGHLVMFQLSQVKGKKALHLYININMYSMGEAHLPHCFQLFKRK